MALIVGKIMVKEQEELHQVFVYSAKSKKEFELMYLQTLHKRFRFYSKRFDFCYIKMKQFESAVGKSLMLMSRKDIVILDYTTNQFMAIY